MRYTTFISGYNTSEAFPRTDLSTLTPAQQAEYTEKSRAWMDEHFVQAKRAGVWKPESVRRLAATLGIVRTLKAEAISFDPSGHGRHVTQKIEL